MNFYTHEKLLELERERLARQPEIDVAAKRPRKAVFGPLAKVSGRALRRVGEGLESWGAPPPTEADHTRGHAQNHM